MLTLTYAEEVVPMLVEPEASPLPEPKNTQAIRARIHKTRAALNRKIDLLKTRIFGPSTRTTPMARRSSTKKSAGKKSTAKTKKATAQRSAARKKKPAGRVKARRAATKARGRATKARRPPTKARKVI